MARSLPRELAQRACFVLVCLCAGCASPRHSGNPLFPGWYADPEVALLEHQCWIVPTTSAAYDEQTSFDAFSSPDLVHWTRHPRVLDLSRVAWARCARWVLFSADPAQSTAFRSRVGWSRSPR